MGIALSTAGVSLGYCVETTKGTRPTTGYTIIHDIKSTPSFNPEPESLETTDLSQTEYKTFTAGLKDLSGASAFTVNLTNDFISEWNTLMSAYDTAFADDKNTWFEIKHPDLDKSVFFTGKPSKLGLPEMSVGSVLEAEVYITPTGAPVWETKTTNA